MADQIRRACCHVHGGNPADVRLLHEHHVKPKGYGGQDVVDNRAWLCASCHDLVHRMSHLYAGNKQGVANDLAMQYLPGSPAARKRLIHLVAEVAKSMNDHVPELGDEDDEDDTVIVSLHIPRKLHHKLKTCAANYSNAKSGRRMGLYNYILKVLKNNVAVQLHSPGAHIDPVKKYGVTETSTAPERNINPEDPILQEME